MQKKYVPDGFFILARQIFESAIWRDDPHVLKLFIYLMGNARHSKAAKKYPLFEVKRGELVTSLAKISEENEYNQNGTLKKWSRMKVSRMLDLLEKQGYIKKLCDTYGTHISICNYNVYQEFDNYKCDTPVTSLLHSCDTSVTQVLLNNKDNKGNKDKEDKHIHGEFKNVLLTEAEYKKLVDKFNGQANDKIEVLSEYIASKGVKYTSHYATILSWSRRDDKKPQSKEPELRKF